MFFSLEHKTALVTGGISGIGLAVARRFLAAGAKVVVTDLRDGNDTAREMGAAFFRADVADEQETIAAFEFAEKTFGKLDIVVNNAGVGDVGGRLQEMDSALWDKIMRVNVYGVLLGCKHAPRFMNDGGSIINTASQAAMTKVPTFEPYSASKSAVVSLTQTAALELASRQIRVNAVCPTAIRTPMLPDDDDEILLAEACIPLGRPGETEDVVGLYHFLASDDSRFINGQAILVDGGWTAGLSDRLIELIIKSTKEERS